MSKPQNIKEWDERRKMIARQAWGTCPACGRWRQLAICDNMNRHECFSCHAKESMKRL